MAEMCVIILYMAEESLRSTSQFWEERAQAFAHSDEEGWGAVCYRGAPLYVNRFIDWSQRRAFSRLLTAARFSKDDAALDIGCGTGRWTRALADAGLRARGFDVSPSMVARAREIFPHLTFDVASATSLPIDDASVQVASSITVYHHLEYGEQEKAIKELARVVRPGGVALVIVLLNTIPSGAWCYTRNRANWLDLFRQHGFEPRLVLGEEYVGPGVLFTAAASAVAKLRRGKSAPDDPSAVAGTGPARALLGSAYRVAIAASYPVEAVLQRLPGTLGATGLAVTLYRCK